MPPGAIRVEESPSSTFDLSYQGWWCSPMATSLGYWTVEGMSMVEVSNWLIEHPVPGLNSTRTSPLIVSEAADVVTLGNVPERDSIEGIAFTVVKSGEGVAIRAEAGVIPETTVCYTPDPGEELGSPGEG